MAINCIPNNTEKYMAFILGKYLVFIDIFQFMASSLDALVNNLPQEDFKYTSEEFKDEKLELLKQKGIYPYDYMGGFEGFDEIELPSKDKFYSKLTDENISDQDYEHAKKYLE